MLDAGLNCNAEFTRIVALLKGNAHFEYVRAFYETCKFSSHTARERHLYIIYLSCLASLYYYTRTHYKWHARIVRRVCVDDDDDDDRRRQRLRSNTIVECATCATCVLNTRMCVSVAVCVFVRRVCAFCELYAYKTKRFLAA